MHPAPPPPPTCHPTPATHPATLRPPPPQVDILCTHPMYGPDSGKGSWAGLNFMYEKVRIGEDEARQQRVDTFLQVGVDTCKASRLRCSCSVSGSRCFESSVGVLCQTRVCGSSTWIPDTFH